MALDLTQLTAAVAKDTDVEGSAITLLTGLKAKLDKALVDLAAAGNSPAELQQLQDLSNAIGTNSDALAAAVTANTPSEG